MAMTDWHDREDRNPAQLLDMIEEIFARKDDVILGCHRRKLNPVYGYEEPYELSASIRFEEEGHLALLSFTIRDNTGDFISTFTSDMAYVYMNRGKEIREWEAANAV